MDLRGIFPALTTPFAPDGALALDRLRENLARYNRTRLAGYVVAGSTGEAVFLREAELEQLWAAARDAAAPEKLLIAGTGVESTEQTIELTNRAAALGYHAALVKTPHYFKPQMHAEAETEHFLRVADEARIPVLVYSVPQFTGVAVEAPVVTRLAQHPNIIGMKESSGDIARVGRIIRSTPASFQTLVGSASTLYDSLAAGAVGGILAAACFLPELSVELLGAFQAGEHERARAVQQRLVAPAMRIVGELGIAGIKYAMDCAGYYGGPARRPLLPLSEPQKREVEFILAGVTAGLAARP